MPASPDQILAALDPEQRRVAEAVHGPVVVLAGAGTGKTRAMTHRIAYGVAVDAFDPSGVLALTFTTRAAGELRGRLASLGVGGVQARTFHSAALRQAQYFWPRVYGSELPAVADSVVSLAVEAARRERLSPDTSLIRDLLGEISWAKVSNVAPVDYASVAAQRGRSVSGHGADTVARVMTRYESVKAARGLIDFDDILLCAAGVLSESPEAAAAVRRQYRTLVVDEYQDVSPLQQALLDLWRGDHEELCVVGDPAQTIHSFAGAQASFLTTFAQRHPRAVTIELVRDYRSSPQVVAVANRVIAGGGVTLQAMAPPGPEPTFEVAPSEAAEASAVAAWCRRLADTGVPWSEMAVLYRIHAMSPAFEAAFSEAGLPFATRGSDGFFERGEVRTALRALETLTPDADATPALVMRQALAGLGWTPEPPSSQGALRERWESWAALATLAEDFETRHPDADVAALIAELAERRQAQRAPAGAGITLSTLHSAKGLEWDAVALVGVHDGALPFVLATSPEAIEEERRLLYVGVTRARRHLRISWSTTRSGGGPRRAPSRFLAPLGVAASESEAAPRRRRPSATSALSQTCRVCGRGLTSGRERKLGRHTDCPASVDEGVFEALRAWRLGVASAASVPAFVIFTDATLQAMAEAQPTRLADLARIPGVGATKLGRYGEAVLAVLSGAVGAAASGEKQKADG